MDPRPEPEEEALLNREYELRLIRCTLSPSPSTSPPQSSPSDQAHNLNTLINHLLALIESGNYSEVFNSEASRLIFQLGDDSPIVFDDSLDCADRLYSELLKRAESFIDVNSANDAAKASRIMLVMCIAVAALLAFSQCSITGPLNGLPRCPLPLEAGKGDEYRGWDSWARNQLMSAGSDLLGKFSNIQVLMHLTPNLLT